VTICCVIVLNVNTENINVIGLTPGPSPEERGISSVNAMRLFLKDFILVSLEFSEP
jgi:hypothetical protein